MNFRPQALSSSGWKEVWSVLLAAFVLCLAGCAPAAVRFKPGEIPQARAMTPDEYRAGEQLRNALLQQTRVSQDPRYARRVEFVMSRLLAVAPNSEHWKVYVLEVPEWNAMTTPGNFVYVFTGLLDSLQDDDELSAVLAHELAHRLALHQEPSLEEVLGQLTVALAQAGVEAAVQQQGGAPIAAKGAANLAGAVIGGFAVNPYSQAKESEADLIGLFLMADAGFHPSKAVRVWHMRALAGEDAPKFFSTHPPSAERQAFLSTYLAEAEQRYRNAQAAKNDEGSGGTRQSSPALSPAAERTIAEAGELAANYRFSEARQLLESLVQREPRNSSAWGMLGVVHAKDQRLDRSEGALRTALSLAPDDGIAHYNMACVKSLKGDRPGAVTSLKKAFSIDPNLRETAKDDPDLYMLRGNVEFDRLMSAPPPAQKGGATFSVNRL